MKLQTKTPFVVMTVSTFIVFGTVWSGKYWATCFLINGTFSEPQGLYRLVEHQSAGYRRGMMVVFPVPVQFRGLVYGRGWLQPGVPLLKEMLAIEGDQVCVADDGLAINDRFIGPVFTVDSQGQSLPRIRGCFTVAPGEFFAASGSFPKSFDGRYFGALRLTSLEGEACPLWTF